MKKAQILFCKQAYKDFRIFDEKSGLSSGGRRDLPKR